MVAPVSGSANAIPLQRTAQTQNVNANQTANRNVAQTVLNSTPSKANKPNTGVKLASANAQPQQNLPRGSIVDKLV